MVYFNCDACGDSLKKNEVEKHRYRCRNCHILSCVDCNKDFRGNEYQQHTKCVSEEERYSGKNYKPKPNANKGELKQELWTQQVQEAIRKAKTNNRLRGALEQLTSYQNIPRKKPKFVNFIISSLHIRDQKFISEIWDAISAEFVAAQTAKTNGKESSNENSSKTTDVVKEAIPVNEKPAMESAECERKERKRDKKKKHKREDTMEVEVSAEGVDNVDDQCHTEGKDSRKKKKGKKSELEVKRDVNGKTAQENAEEQTRKNLITQCGGAVEQTNGESVDEKPRKKRKKEKRQFAELAAEADEVASETACKRIKTDKDSLQSPDLAETTCGKFKWDATIIGVLKRAPDNQLSIKKLRKKVLSEFNAQHGDGKVYTEEKLMSKFTHKVHSCSRLKVHKELVKLIS